MPASVHSDVSVPYAAVKQSLLSERRLRVSRSKSVKAFVVVVVVERVVSLAGVHLSQSNLEKPGRLRTESGRHCSALLGMDAETRMHGAAAALLTHNIHEA